MDDEEDRMLVPVGSEALMEILPSAYGNGQANVRELTHRPKRQKPTLRVIDGGKECQ